MAHKKVQTAKQWAYTTLEHPFQATPGGKAVALVLFAFIIGNAVLVLIPNDWASAEFDLFIVVFNIASTIVFAGEYFTRIWIADKVYPQIRPAKARVRYVFSLMGIIDLLSFVLSYFMLLIPKTTAMRNVIIIIRLIRLIKISRYMRGLHTIGAVLVNRREEIIAAITVLALLTIAASVLMYEAEHAAQPDAFNNVLTGIYWAITTITTTGYGDLVPITAMGRFIGFVVMVLSIAIVAIPAGIFSAGFVEEFRNQRSRHHEKLRKEQKSELIDS